MLTKTVTVHEGEWLGPIPEDWDAREFVGHHAIREDSALRGLELCREAAAALDRGAKVVCYDCYGGSARELLWVGMYDGWAFWKPRPCFAYRSPLGGSEHGEFYNLRQIQISEHSQQGDLK